MARARKCSLWGLVLEGGEVGKGEFTDLALVPVGCAEEVVGGAQQKEEVMCISD